MWSCSFPGQAPTDNALVEDVNGLLTPSIVCVRFLSKVIAFVPNAQVARWQSH